MNRPLQILLGRPVANHQRGAVIQLMLLFVWQFLIIRIPQVIAAAVSVPASRYWHRRAVVPFYLTDANVVESETTAFESLVLTLSAMIIVLMATGLIGWIGFRLLRPGRRPRVSVFIRFWWRSNIWGTILLLALSGLASLYPMIPSQTPVIWTLFAIQTFYWATAPALFARHELRFRARRINSICPVCRYWLRERTTNRCPECGTPLAPHPAGGLMIMGETRSSSGGEV